MEFEVPYILCFNKSKHETSIVWSQGSWEQSNTSMNRSNDMSILFQPSSLQPIIQPVTVGLLFKVFLTYLVCVHNKAFELIAHEVLASRISQVFQIWLQHINFYSSKLHYFRFVEYFKNAESLKNKTLKS